MPGSMCLVTNAHEMTGDLLETTGILSNNLPTKVVGKTHYL